MQPEIKPPETTALRQEALVLVKEAEGITIATDQEYQRAGSYLVRIATVRKNIVAAFKDAKEKAFAAHRAITKLEADLLAQPAKAEQIVKAAIGRYQQEQEKKRREEQPRLQAQLQREQEDRRLAEAEALAQTGHQVEAEALLDAPILAPVVEIERPTAAGVSTRKAFKFRVLDVTKINPDFLIPDETKIRKTVNALGADAVKVVGAGIEVYEDRIVAVRAQ